MDILKKIPGCEEVTDGDVGEWVGQDENCGRLGDGEIDALVKEIKVKMNQKLERREDNKEVKKMTHIQGLKVVEGMRYMEEQGACCFSVAYMLELNENEMSVRANPLASQEF